MLSRKLSLVLRVGLVCLLLFIAFKIGVHVGTYESWLMDSSAKASLLVGELRAIRGGKAEKLIEPKEIELDGAITQALRFRDSGLSWLFYPFAEGYDHDRYLRSAAGYRKEYLSPTPKLDFGTEGDLKQQMEAYRVEVALRMSQLQQRYGNSGADAQPIIYGHPPKSRLTGFLVFLGESPAVVYPAS
jgi:hypothetical protein